MFSSDMMLTIIFDISYLKPIEKMKPSKEKTLKEEPTVAISLSTYEK